MNQTIAFFDFDGTITRKDSFVDFVIFAVGRFAFLLGILINSMTLLGYKLGYISNSIAKERLWSAFFRGWKAEEFQTAADRYSHEQMNKIIRAEAVERIEWHKNKGHIVVVVTASLEPWLKLWCDKNGLELIATKIEIDHGVLTGRFMTRNCYAGEKVNRIKEKYDLRQFKCIYAYGDSKGDFEMLNLADKKYFRKFK
ncbi:MAG TPA: HAD-IB family hydrolase [Spirochaetota bacterium]|jgi:HAD superfamily hydrolase (TIGR01490 family)|nr:HAD-IB family hydrolase [Spirochaetota bacterium]